MIKQLKKILPCLAILVFGSASCSSMFLERDNSMDDDVLYGDEELTANTFNAVDRRINSYSVTWKNEKGEVLRIDSNVSEGTIPDYGCDPSYTVGDTGYRFIRWEPTPKEIYSNAFYTGIFVEESTICDFKPIYNDNGKLTSYSVEGLSYFYHGSTLTIPSSYKGHPVTQISDNAFAGDKTLEYLVIPESVIYVGDGALNNMKKLRYVEFKADRVYFEEYALAYSSNLTNVVLPKYQEVLSNHMFSYCESLNTINLPDSLTTISDSAFSNCKSLAEITIPSNVTSIGERAFYNNHNLRNVVFNSTKLNIINNWAFYFCNLVEINLPDGLETISERAFDYNPNLRRIRIPIGIKTIENYAFGRCGNIPYASIPYKIQNLCESAFIGTTIDNVNTDVSQAMMFRVSLFGASTDAGDNEGLRSAKVYASSHESQEVFNQHQNDKIVVYRNYNGKALQTSFGDQSYLGITPTKPSDSNRSYTFSYWDKKYYSTSNIEEYTAIYS